METTTHKNSILNALLQQAMFGAQNPVNLSLSSSNSHDERSEVTSSSSSAEEDSPADLSSRHQPLPEEGSHLPHLPSHPDLMQAMAAAFTFQRDLLQQTPAASTSPPLADASHLVAKALASATMRRPRSEKKPIPDDLKDNKYYERRRRNNLAAKRSRDMRKNREDQVTLRANYLEKENSVLRAQVATLRDEAFALKQMLLHKQASAILRSQAATS